jgi:hypothetical protein
MMIATNTPQLSALLASLLFVQAMNPAAPYLQNNHLSKVQASSWHLPIPVPLTDLPWENTPTRCSSPITAATNSTQPNHKGVPDVIYPIVAFGNTSCIHFSIPELLLNTATNHKEVPEVIYPIVALGNTSDINFSILELLLNTNVLPLMSSIAMPAISIS